MVLANNVNEGRSVPSLPAEAPRLRVGAPSYNPDFFAETAELVTLIGSRRDCHLPVPLTDISKIHCAICNTGRDLLICDLRSRTGTFVNEQQTLATALSPGDSVRIANVPIELEFVRPPAPAASPEAARRLSRALRIALPGRTLTLDTQPIVIGKRSNCDIVVDTPDVSLAHALLFTVCGCPVIYDLGSRSGTLLNGKRVTLAWLKDGDRLGIGGESLVVGWDGPTFEPPPVAAAGAAAPPTAGLDLGAAMPELPASAVGPSALENMIASLQGQLAAFRTRLEKRAVELDQRSAQVDALTAELTQQRTGLEAMRTQVAARADRLEHDRRLMLRRRAKLRKALVVFREHKERIERRQTELAAALHELEQERQRILGIEQDVAAREGRLGAAQEELSHRLEAVDVQARSLETQSRELAEQQQIARLREQAIAQQEAGLVQREQDLAQRQTALIACEQALTQRDRDLSARGDDLLAREQELNEHQETLAAMESDLLARRQALATADATLRQRELAVVESEKRILQLKSALERAAQAFSGMSLDVPVAPEAPSPPARLDAAAASGEPVPRGPGLTGREAAGSAAAPPPVHVMNVSEARVPPPAPSALAGNGALAGAAGLPAPIVDQPLFAGLPAVQQLPAEMQERLRVLRRVSDRSDEELVAQVLAEMDAKGSEPAAPPKRKKKRGWLS